MHPYTGVVLANWAYYAVITTFNIKSMLLLQLYHHMDLTRFAVAFDKFAKCFEAFLLNVNLQGSP